MKEAMEGGAPREASEALQGRRSGDGSDITGAQAMFLLAYREVGAGPYAPACSMHPPPPTAVAAVSCRPRGQSCSTPRVVPGRESTEEACTHTALEAHRPGPPKAPLQALPANPSHHLPHPSGSLPAEPSPEHSLPNTAAPAGLPRAACHAGQGGAGGGGGRGRQLLLLPPHLLLLARLHPAPQLRAGGQAQARL